MLCIDDAHNVICVGFMIAGLTMWTSLVTSLPLILVIMTACESSVTKQTL